MLIRWFKFLIKIAKNIFYNRSPEWVWTHSAFGLISFIKILCSGEYSEGKTIAKTTDGWQINEVVEDDTHTFVVLRSFLDQYLLVKEDYQISTSGAVTIAVWNGKNIYDEHFHVTLSKILEQATTDFEYETDGIFQLTDNQI